MTHHAIPATFTAAAPAAVGELAPIAEAAALAARATLARSRVPPFLHLLAEGDGEALRFTGTDGDVTVTVTAPAAADGFRAAIPARPFAAAVKAAGGELLAMLGEQGADGAGVAIETEGARASFPGLPVDDWPRLDAPEAMDKPHVAADVDRAALLGALKACDHAMSTEETRFYLNGIFCEWIGSGDPFRLAFTSTDGHRLAHVDSGIPVPPPDFVSYDSAPGVIIPRATVRHMLAALRRKGCPDVVRLVIGTRLRLVAGAVDIVSNLIGASFPDYPRVMPRDMPRGFTVDRRAFAEAVKGAAAGGGRANQCAVKLTVGDGMVTVSRRDRETGWEAAARSIPADTEAADVGFSIGFAAGYLGDLCKAAKGDRIRLQFHDSGSPMRVDDPAAVFVVMPMRV